ncbi:hypothetical protein [Dubosiella newyorkensis]|uniref:hypothetical protein n=1 Tax=Dubosiella newyorkensis TaxID=1862672 RepID=UPI003F66A702
MDMEATSESRTQKTSIVLAHVPGVFERSSTAEKNIQETEAYRALERIRTDIPFERELQKLEPAGGAKSGIGWNGRFGPEVFAWQKNY